jgi:hypothetical protein
MDLKKRQVSLAKNSLLRNKKGVVFTILAIAIAVFFTLVFSARIEKPIDYKTEVLETRINVLSDYLNNFYDYAESAASVSGYSALKGIITDLNDMKALGIYFNPNFEEQYTNCTLIGNLTSSEKCPNMINKTITYYLDNIKDIVEDKLIIKSNYTINSINVTQVEPFSVELTLNISLDINDSYANLSDTRVIVSSVSIQGLLDPLYLIYGTYNQTIDRTTIPKSGGEVGAQWNYTDLQQLYNNHEYKQALNGISFINRIKGDLSPPPSYLGIESFVNLTNPGVIAKLAASPYPQNYSLVDYLFWTDNTRSCKNDIMQINNDSIMNSSGNPTIKFQLDQDHMNTFVIFTIGGLYTTYTCP